MSQLEAEGEDVCKRKWNDRNGCESSSSFSGGLAQEGPLNKKTRVEEPGSALGEQLKEFQLLDECDGSDEEVDHDSECKSDFGNDSDDTDIENLLDEALPDDLKGKRKPEYDERFKTVLEEKGYNHFEVLPEGWVQVTHNSGMPLFLHRQSRVCTLARPYFLGPGSVRKHEIPLGAIPCLNYRKALEKEDDEKRANECPIPKLEEEMPVDTPDTTADNGIAITSVPGLPAAKIETVHENIKAQSLSATQVNDYCKKLFQFKNIRVLRFKSWSARRKFTKNRKQIKNLQRPTLPEGTQLIKFPIVPTPGESTQNTRTRKEFTLNPNGKSSVCILHEYIQHAMKMQPTYEFKELENASTPYSATVSLKDLIYGIGYGTSKKQAKSEAARAALEVFIPDIKKKIPGFKTEKSSDGKSNYKDLSVFDDIKVEDPRVAEFCNKTTEPSPHACLLVCLQRNYGLGDDKIVCDINMTKNKKNEFKMTVGRHSATVICKNKREGKQLASQAILQKLHPHVDNWGAMLRLYGNNSIKTFKEKKLEEQEITVLQSKAAVNQPNHAILDKLRSEMLKLSERRNAVQPIGVFVPPMGVLLPTSSSSNLNNVVL